MNKFLVLLVILFSVVGCGKRSANAKEPINLVWYGVGPRPVDTDIVFEEVNKYLKEKIGVTIEYKSSDWGEFYTKMQMLSSSGEDYDIAFTASWTNYPQFVGNGAFIPLDDLLKKEGKDLSDVIPKEVFEGAKINGKIYAVPNMKEMADFQVFRVNETYVKKYNLDLENIKNLEDFFPAFEIIKEKEKNFYTLVVTKGSPEGHESLDPLIEIRMPGAIKVTNDDFKIINQFEDKEFVENLKRLRKAYLKGYISKDALTKDESEAEKVSGKWFVDQGGYQPGAEKIWERSYNFKVGIIPKYQNAIMSTASVTGSMLAISTSSKHPDKAMEFINLLNTDKYLRNLINIGIEGVHYKKTDENTVEILEQGKKNYQMPAFSLGNLFLTYSYSDDIPNKWEKFKKFNETAIVSPILGFTFDINPVKQEVAAIKNIAEEYYPRLNTGASDTAKTIKEMTDKMNRAGLEKILDEMQKQVDIWRKNKGK